MNSIIPPEEIATAAAVGIMSRHGEKDRKPGIIPGSWVDKHVTHVTLKGWKDMVAAGVEMLDPVEYQTVLCLLSDFIRTRESAEAFYSSIRGLLDRVVMPARQGLGFGIPVHGGSIDWKAYDAPTFSGSDQAVQDRCISRLYSDFVVQEEGKPRRIAVGPMMHGYVHALGDGLEMMRDIHGAKRGPARFDLFGNAPCIDSIGALVTEWMTVDPKTGIVVTDKRKFPGAMMQGDHYEQRLTRLGSKNPTLEVYVPSHGKVVQKGFKLSDLRRMEEELRPLVDHVYTPRS